MLQTANSSLSDASPAVAAALALFQQSTGAEATYLVSAPGRVNLIGEYTDFNGGYVLPMAIELGIYVAARRREDTTARIWSAQLPGEVAQFELRAEISKGLPPWSNYVRGVMAGLQQAGLELPGFDAVVYATLPPSGGLSSSAAIEVAFATLGEALTGVTLEPVTKALLCQTAEHVFAGTPCGIMDQFAIIFGRRGNLLLLNCQTTEHELVSLKGSDVALLVINTMVKHALNDGGYRSRRDDCFEAARLLGVENLSQTTPQRVAQAQELLGERLFRRARHVTGENERTLAAAAALRAGAWEQLGRLMYESHRSLRDDFEVSCAELDMVVEAASGLAGVYGCRMTGGGFGGCCIALVAAGQAAAISEALRADYSARRGLDAMIFATLPADGPAILLRP